MLLVDTKYEMGKAEDGTIMLVDEVLCIDCKLVFMWVGAEVFMWLVQWFTMWLPSPLAHICNTHPVVYCPPLREHTLLCTAPCPSPSPALQIHTPDSSRYWLADSYEARLAAGQEPQNIDKEFLRLWFRSACDPYNDPVLPEAPAELVTELSRRYVYLYQTITGEVFEPAVHDNPAQRIREAVLAAL